MQRHEIHLRRDVGAGKNARIQVLRSRELDVGDSPIPIRHRDIPQSMSNSVVETCCVMFRDTTLRHGSPARFAVSADNCLRDLKREHHRPRVVADARDRHRASSGVDVVGVGERIVRPLHQLMHMVVQLRVQRRQVVIVHRAGPVHVRRNKRAAGEVVGREPFLHLVAQPLIRDVPLDEEPVVLGKHPVAIDVPRRIRRHVQVRLRCHVRKPHCRSFSRTVIYERVRRARLDDIRAGEVAQQPHVKRIDLALRHTVDVRGVRQPVQPGAVRRIGKLAYARRASDLRAAIRHHHGRIGISADPRRVPRQDDGIENRPCVRARINHDRRAVPDA